jgi:hypothetical protein
MVSTFSSDLPKILPENPAVPVKKNTAMKKLKEAGEASA